MALCCATIRFVARSGLFLTNVSSDPSGISSVENPSTSVSNRRRASVSLRRTAIDSTCPMAGLYSMTSRDLIWSIGGRMPPEGACPREERQGTASIAAAMKRRRIHMKLPCVPAPSACAKQSTTATCGRRRIWGWPSTSPIRSRAEMTTRCGTVAQHGARNGTNRETTTLAPIPPVPRCPHSPGCGHRPPAGDAAQSRRSWCGRACTCPDPPRPRSTRHPSWSPAP